MKKLILVAFVSFLSLCLFAGSVEKVYTFSDYTVKQNGTYSSITFDHTMLSGIPGEPMLPYQEVSLLLSPGETAISIEVIGENEVTIPGSFLLYPKQEPMPISKGPSGQFLKNETVYHQNSTYPVNMTGHLTTQFLNGYAFALTTFTPLRYNPLTGKISFYQTVTIRIKTKQNEKSSDLTKNMTSSVNALNRVKAFAQNPEMMNKYPVRKSSASEYQLLIITRNAFQAAFAPLIDMYSAKGILTQVKTVEDITSTVTGIDLADKIRNYIKEQYQNNSIEYVLLGSNVPNIPARGFYCYVISGSGYEETNIPADLYYSGMDGDYDLNANQIYGEVADSADLLPEVAIARMPVTDTAQLNHLIHKSIYYQTHPVLGEFEQPLLVGEHLYDDPITEGGDYMELLIDDHSDNGYFTNGIPSATNTIDKLYDGGSYNWNVNELLTKINAGKSFIHHLGHANETYVMRLFTFDINDQNFSQIDGVTHNYQFLYTQGCLCGAFDNPDCIASKMLTIHNFLAGGVFNSRYGWFDQGFTEGPSEHLQREFVNAMYRDTTPDRHFGTAHLISKINTAPWINLPGEFEPGAQRWCHYCANALGDPAMEINITEPAPTGIAGKTQNIPVTIYPNPATDHILITYTLAIPSTVNVTLFNISGQAISETMSAADQVKGEHTMQIATSGLQAGTYFCKIDAGKTSWIKKFLVIK